MKKDRLFAIIRALAAKTTANGCTEEEAVSAASKLAELLAKHNVTLDEAKLRETPFARHSEAHFDMVGERLWKVADGIAHMTGARYWTSANGVHPVVINFFGFEHEVEVARYLLEICAYAMRSERGRLLRTHALLRPEARRRRIVPFLDGMADSLRRRIRELKPTEPIGKGLAVVKDALVEAALADSGIGLTKGRAARSRDFEESYAQGVAAGDRVSLNPGLTGAADRKRLG